MPIGNNIFDTASEGVIECLVMAIVTPQYSRSAVDKAGQDITNFPRHSDEYIKAIGVLNNWRAAHGYPLLIFRNTLYNRAKKVYNGAVVVQRIKRLPSIESKLINLPGQRLSQVQDIGGCRAILDNIDQVLALQKKYLTGDFSHRLLNHDDYIETPKATGYRGIHLIYSYNSEMKTEFNKLRIEIQLRTKLQHAWATAVESFATILGQSFKSNEGSPAWHRFFALVSTAISIQEQCPTVENTPCEQDAIKKELIDLVQSLQIRDKVIALSLVRHVIGLNDVTKGGYILLTLDTKERNVTVRSFSKNQVTQATLAYNDAELAYAADSTKDVVLVSVDSMHSLNIAYPNYFWDMEVFWKFVLMVIGEIQEEIH
jgi:ppGpp synthetase/RelA/SpoT-type nucleotidyltranferase